MTNEERKALIDELSLCDREIYLPVLGKAADQIEADGKRIAELEERYNELGEAAISQVADLAAKSGRKDVEIDAASADLNAAKRRIAELEATLKRIARERYDDNAERELTANDLRIIARAALGEGK